jgi:hypothetical protein
MACAIRVLAEERPIKIGLKFFPWFALICIEVPVLAS